MKLGDKVFQAIERIASEPKTSLKVQYLKEAFESDFGELFRKVMLYAYDPGRNYGIRFVEPKAGYAADIDISDEHCWMLLDKLVSRDITGNAARESVFQCIRSLNPESAEVFRRIIHKDMRAGFSAGSLNKVEKNLIAEPAYMRCSLPATSNISSWNWDNGVYVQLKADGAFTSATRVGDKVVLMSRSGEIMPDDALVDLKTELWAIIPDGYRVDGELLVYLNGELLLRAEGNGLLNSIRQGGELPDGYEVRISLWDIIKPSDIGTSKETYSKRLEILGAACREFPERKLVFVIDTTKVFDKSTAVSICRDYMERGLEGVILKNPNALYKDGTSKDQVKLKIEAETDVKVTGFIEGAKGKKTEKTFGALTFESLDGGVKGSTSGFTDAQRKAINDDREDWIGAIITVRANDITKGRDSDYFALSHPRFVERRTDKYEADTTEKIQEIFKAARENF